MVTEYGMNPGLDPRTFETGPEMLATGKESDLVYGCSDVSAERIYDEIGNLLHKARETASEVIQSNRAMLSKLAQRLLVDETIEGQELLRMLDGSGEEGSLAASHRLRRSPLLLGRKLVIILSPFSPIYRCGWLRPVGKLV